ncbi:MAG: DNA polymerase III subunit delta [Bacteroidaceae bacterium]|nr:DNA polymerase III subunit delta [Bacteroidaceae bacterium]
MAKYTYESIFSELKKGVYHPVYYLMGEEGFYTDRLTEYIAEHALPEDERGFNQTVLYGLDTTMDAVVDAARSFPMMAERQVIIVKEAQQLKNTDALSSYLKHPQPTTVLVFAHKNGSLDKRKKIVAELEKAGVVLEFKKLKDEQLPAFVNNYMRGKGVVADAKTVLMICESIGADLSRIAGEIDKLCLALPEDSQTITPELVEENIGISKEYNNFELQSALVRKDVYKANKIINYFASNPKKNPIQLTLAILFGFFSNVMMAYYAPDKSERGVAAYLGLKSAWGVGDYITAMKNYRAVHVMQILHQIRLADARSKGADAITVPDAEIMKELLFFILH